MKKFAGVAVFAIVLLIGLPTMGSAQNLVGAKGGVVIANVSASDEQELEGNDTRTGAGFGVFFRAMVAPDISVQPELLYQVKGFQGNDAETSGKFSLKYIQVPVLLQYHLSSGPGVSPRIVVGPAIAFESGCKISGSDGSVDVSLDCEEADIATKSKDFSAVFGAGVDIPTNGILITGTFATTWACRTSTTRAPTGA
jgi:hypothetical protein